MEEDLFVFKPNTMTVLVRRLLLLPISASYLLLYVVIGQVSFRAVLGGIVFILFVLILMHAINPVKKYTVVISSTSVEGIGDDFRKRVVVPVDEINIAECRPPALLRPGFLKTFNGELIYLPHYFFNSRDTQTILDAIIKRQTNLPAAGVNE